MSEIKNLVERIKSKRELSGIPDSLVAELLNSYLSKYKINPRTLKKSQEKTLVKEIRSQLRRNTGMFQIGKKDRNALLNQGKIHQILKTHSSTNERISFYPQITSLIYSLNPSSILDLGCGLNPLAIAKPGIRYYAVDIQTTELELIDSFFKKNKIAGKTILMDIRKLSDDLPSVDLCLIFKVLDILAKNNRSISAEILDKIKAKNFIISFSTKTLSGKPMKQPRRLWFERLLSTKQIKFEIRQFENEIFYIFKSSKE